MTSSASLSILNRSSLIQNTVLSPLQSQVDGLVSHFVEEAASPTTLAAMMAGGIAYRFGRIGVMAAGSGHVTAMPLRILSVGVGLGTEVSAFELTNRSFATFSGNQTNPNLWHWSGQGGWAQGLTSSAITFGLLKGAGFAAREQNLVFQHALQSTAMVAGHNTAGILGIADRPQGSLAEQILHAEATNLQLGAGMGLAHSLMPGMHALERGLDLSLQNSRAHGRAPLRNPFESDPTFAMAGTFGNGRGGFEPRDSRFFPTILLSENQQGKDGGETPAPETTGTPTVSGERAVETPETTPKESAVVTREDIVLTMPPPQFVPTRYHLPRTPYFNELGPTMNLEKLAGYARSERRAHLVGMNLQNSLLIPLAGAEEYSPFGAGLVERVRENPRNAHFFTGKWNRALVASPATAILGLGEAAISDDFHLNAIAADVIMQGKAKYFLYTAGVGTTPLCVSTRFSEAEIKELRQMPPRQAAEQARIWRAQKFAETVRSLADNFGFINIEDAQGKDLPIIFGVLESLRGATTIWSDDKQGTGVITASAMLSWAELTRRRMEDIRGVIFGAGAGAAGVYDELINNGMRPENILATDSKGALHQGRTDISSDPFKVRMAEGIPDGTRREDYLEGADFVINLGVKETFTADLAQTRRWALRLAANPFFGPMTNPEPGISPEQLHEIRPDAYYGSGNQTYENTVNNFTAFGYIGAGSLMAMAGGVGPGMTVAAARGISRVAKMGPSPEMRDRLPENQQAFGQHWLVPHPEDIRLISEEAGSVSRAAAREGLAILLGPNPTQDALARFDAEIERKVRFRTDFVQEMRDRMAHQGRRYLQLRYPERHAPFSFKENPKSKAVGYDVAPEIDRGEFEHYARQMGVDTARWETLLSTDGSLQPIALTEALEQLVPATQMGTPQAELAARELKFITYIADISPALGLALAVRRTRVRPENLERRPTLFHREEVLRVLYHVIPEARRDIEKNFPGVPDLP